MSFCLSTGSRQLKTTGSRRDEGQILVGRHESHWRLNPQSWHLQRPAGAPLSRRLPSEARPLLGADQLSSVFFSASVGASVSSVLRAFFSFAPAVLLR